MGTSFSDLDAKTKTEIRDWLAGMDATGDETFPGIPIPSAILERFDKAFEEDPALILEAIKARQDWLQSQVRYGSNPNTDHIGLFNYELLNASALGLQAVGNRLFWELKRQMLRRSTPTHA